MSNCLIVISYRNTLVSFLRSVKVAMDIVSRHADSIDNVIRGTRYSTCDAWNNNASVSARGKAAFAKNGIVIEGRILLGLDSPDGLHSRPGSFVPGEPRRFRV